MTTEMVKKMDRDDVFGLADAFGIEEDIRVDYDYLCSLVARAVNGD